jgi:hypothetical protein
VCVGQLVRASEFELLVLCVGLLVRASGFEPSSVLLLHVRVCSTQKRKQRMSETTQKLQKVTTSHCEHVESEVSVDSSSKLRV